jgi:hypothetical protein
MEAVPPLTPENWVRATDVRHRAEIVSQATDATRHAGS